MQLKSKSVFHALFYQELYSQENKREVETVSPRLKSPRSFDLRVDPQSKGLMEFVTRKSPEKCLENQES